MKKARRENGDVLLAHQYKPEEKAHLLCADEECGAEMLFRKEGLTHGSLTMRAACFVSRDVRQHVANCTAHEDLAIRGKRKKSIEQGLKDGQAIVINLNIGLTEEFNSVAGGVAMPSTRELGNYVAVPAKNVEDLLAFRQTVTEAKGDEGIARTFVNYRRKLMPLAEFVVDAPEKFTALLTRLSAALEQNKTQTAADFPRLLVFNATKPARGGQGPLRGTPVTLPLSHGRKLVLLQRAETAPGLRRTLRGEKVHLVALPSLNAAELSAARQKLERGEQVVFLDVHWKVLGPNQITPVEEKSSHPTQGTLKF